LLGVHQAPSIDAAPGIPRTIGIRPPFGVLTDRQRSPISRQILALVIVGFNADLTHSLVHLTPPGFQVWVEVGPVTWELVALKAEVHTLVLIADSDPTVGIQTGASTTPVAVSLGKVGQQLLERGIVLEGRKES
jgi:hypothetical protein